MTTVRDQVVFEHPAPFVGEPDAEGPMSITAAGWFVDILRRIPRLELEPELCQEDWGVVVFARRDDFRFWIGLSSWYDFEHGWHAHVNHGSGAVLQRFRRSGRDALAGLAMDLHAALGADPQVTRIAWYTEKELGDPNASPAPTPTG